MKNRIKEVRQARNLKGYELADKIGMTKGLISEFERGLKNPSLNTVQALLIALECSFEDLFPSDEA